MMTITDGGAFDIIATEGGEYFGPKDAFDVIGDGATYPANTLDAAVTLHDSGGRQLFPDENA